MRDQRSLMWQSMIMPLAAAAAMLATSGIGAILHEAGYVPVGSQVMRTMTWGDLDFERTGRAVVAESPEAVPPWVLQAAQPVPAGGSSSRITDLEREIRRLSRELERLKGQTAPTPH